MGSEPAKRHDQYFSAEPTVASDPRTVPLALPDGYSELTTDRGVFSAGRIDAGTKYLLAETTVADTAPSTALDLGCGYGPIATTLARRTPTTNVWAIDSNQRALDLCAQNAANLGLTNLHVCAPEAVPADLMFDLIWSNPPIRIGKAALHELLTVWLDRLTPEGTAVLVVQKHLGSDSLHAWLEKNRWPTTRAGSRMGYRLLHVRARP